MRKKEFKKNSRDQWKNTLNKKLNNKTRALAKINYQILKRYVS